MTLFRILSPLKKECTNSREGNDRPEELAGELHSGLVRRHAGLSHGEGFLSEEVLVESRTGPRHFGEAGQGGKDQNPARERTEEYDDKERRDQQVKEKPQGRVDDRGVIVDRRVDIIPLEPGKQAKEKGDGNIECGEKGAAFHGRTFAMR